MHLDHKIPWNLASAHLIIIKCNRQFTPQRTDLFACNKVSESGDLNHFCRVLTATIREFSKTEETKALSSISPDNLISEALRSYPEQYYGLGPHETNSALHNPLSSSHKDLQYWADRAGDQHSGYSSGDGDLSDAVKMLIITVASAYNEDTTTREVAREAVSVLLFLSRHPQVPIHTLANLSWGHGFGVELVADFALEAYLLINLMDGVLSRKRGESNGSFEEVSLLETESFRYFTTKALPDYDYPAQNIPHRAFWNGLGITDNWRYQLTAGGCAGSGEWDTTALDGVKDPLKDADKETRLRLQRYLKLCFTILYIYDMLLREWYGEKEADEKWRDSINSAFESWGCKI
ncbi:hypothetical protein ASPVEDRAFT_195836 [Aspergillus versicolor CBS 583.65]|uniref:Uncharacterized protein n=1 Tax=Aspergillus versicolor CBS 583.65 TaxID=1036611 RepID=A0A1L9PR10_ASPVE|nr:uncharacterized protein ASPVEDRAFT_195836 [Aspergillus versicolor CBS 583.65]OJJ03941.1 hypothetical protein ASPVEDRAFT_195836 [Aspergillus versicolor CBS 583.65]